MKIHTTPLQGLLVIEPTRFGDERGYFYESYNESRFAEQAGPVHFVQDNQSSSVKGVLRGLHYQLNPKAQGKLVRAVVGQVWDVAVDIRRDSPTFGQHYGIELTGENHLQLWIPPGFAHGFVTLTDHAVFQYKVTQYWSREHERGIQWNDPDLSVDWHLDMEPILSAKDQHATPFSVADCF
jgi:dTDP-4-dehydrorhamnose 3,5-epimerase